MDDSKPSGAHLAPIAGQLQLLGLLVEAGPPAVAAAGLWVLDGPARRCAACRHCKQQAQESRQSHGR